MRGEGSGPELIDAACNVLDIVAESCGLNFCIKIGGDIGFLSAEPTGEYLCEEVAEFCREIFDQVRVPTAARATLAHAGWFSVNRSCHTKFILLAIPTHICES